MPPTQPRLWCAKSTCAEHSHTCEGTQMVRLVAVFTQHESRTSNTDCTVDQCTSESSSKVWTSLLNALGKGSSMHALLACQQSLTSTAYPHQIFSLHSCRCDDIVTAAQSCPLLNFPHHLVTPEHQLPRQVWAFARSFSF